MYNSCSKRLVDLTRKQQGAARLPPAARFLSSLAQAHVMIKILGFTETFGPAETLESYCMLA